MDQQQQPWWTAAQRVGFFATAARKFNNDFVPLPPDDVSDREAQAMVQRADMLAALTGVQQGKSNGAIRRAVTL